MKVPRNFEALFLASAVMATAAAYATADAPGARSAAALAASAAVQAVVADSSVPVVVVKARRLTAEEKAALK